MNTSRILLALSLSACFSLLGFAQRPERGGGDRGEQGGFGPPGGGFGPPGGGFGPPGGGFGPPGEGFGGRGGGPEGGFGGRGGGPPSFGPPGGGPPGSSFGGRGSRGGSSGGFDPSSFLSRLDANGNGVLDPDEQQGPAQFIIQRLQQSDPSIKPGQPISIKKVTDGFQKMREGRDGGGGDDRDRERSRDDDAALMPELLVPGFGVESDPEPLMGFGAAAEMMSVSVSEEDQRDANEMIQRFDRNRDGVLSGDELSSRFSGNPLDFDRNRDNKLTASELAVRSALRRESREESRRDDDRRRDRNREEEKTVEVPDVFNGRRSYRPTAGRSLPEGVPGFFTDKDTNRDGQVTMAEFAKEWTDELVYQFFASDLNRDGVITADEALRAVENSTGGPSAGSAMASVSASTSSSPSTEPAKSGDSAAPAPSGPIDDKYIKVGQRIVERYDNNGDKALTPSEWEKMLMSPADADANRDGRITVEEYAVWMQQRERK